MRKKCLIIPVTNLPKIYCVIYITPQLKKLIEISHSHIQSLNDDVHCVLSNTILDFSFKYPNFELVEINNDENISNKIFTFSKINSLISYRHISLNKYIHINNDYVFFSCNSFHNSFHPSYKEFKSEIIPLSQILLC